MYTVVQKNKQEILNSSQRQREREREDKKEGRKEGKKERKKERNQFSFEVVESCGSGAVL